MVYAYGLEAPETPLPLVGVPDTEVNATDQLTVVLAMLLVTTMPGERPEHIVTGEAVATGIVFTVTAEVAKAPVLQVPEQLALR